MSLDLVVSSSFTGFGVLWISVLLFATGGVSALLLASDVGFWVQGSLPSEPRRVAKA